MWKLIAALIVALLSVGCSGLAPAPADDARIEAVLRETLRKYPVLVRDALIALQESERAEERERASRVIQSRKSALFEDPDSPVGGNPSGDVTVVQFFDYRCGYCKRVLPTLVELTRRDGGVRVVYKEFPVLGPESRRAALAALAAQRQGKYLGFHHALMGGEEVNDSAIQRIADTLAIDSARFLKDIDAPDLAKRVETNLALGAAIGVNGTPAFIVGDRLIPGAVGIDELTRLVDEARSSSKKN